jgi:hypothetical protein
MSTEKKPKIIKEPWPTKDAMEQVYKMKLWGVNEAKFYSGDGSHNLEIVIPYLEVLALFLSSFETPLTLCDFGCGDFNIGKQLVKYTKKYIAVDIVEDLIKFNKENFIKENLEFQFLDIAVDQLPTGDCAMIRQVLQHLSNVEVKNVLEKLRQFKYVILTEHIPNGDFIPNKDIISGQGIRLKKGSGLDILRAPFNFAINEEEQLLSIVLEGGKGIIVTTLYTVF